MSCTYQYDIKQYLLVSISDICLNFPDKSVFIKTECYFRSLHSRAGSAFTQLLGQ